MHWQKEHLILMYSHGPFFSYTLLFLGVVLMVPASSTPVYDADKYSECVKPTEFDCGGQTFSVSYPFGSPERSTKCSLPQFHLSCSDKNTLFFDNLGDNYPVEYINYNGSVFKASDFTGESCLPEFDTTLLDSLTVFLKNDMPTKSYYVVVNCTKISCVGPSYYGSGQSDSCDRKESDQAFAAGEKEFWDAFQAGVGLTRSSIQENCSSCVYDGGACGYNSTDPDVFACYYKPPNRGNNRNKKIIGLAAGIGGSLFMCLMFFLYLFRHKTYFKLMFFHRGKRTNEQTFMAFLEKSGSLGPKRYKYSEVKKMTKSFSDKLGQGGYGTVFKGILKDGHLVAVKVLIDSKGNGEEFINEVRSIGRTSHVNIVNLLGFCLEGSKRALIYDYMPNGSLEKYKNTIGWENLYQIAIGIAQGLEYLHHGCNTRMVHFDIKPSNILLDHEFRPKVADFGLAKLSSTQDSKLSMAGARGTIGYIAPELISREFGVVSSKSDVYSYGMLLLEMVGVRHTVEAYMDQASEIYFPHWIYEHMNNDGDLQAWGVTKETDEIARKIIIIGLWCIQSLPVNRPSMSRVIDMLEGSNIDLQMPPRPYLSATLETIHSASSMSISNDVLGEYK